MRGKSENIKQGGLNKGKKLQKGCPKKKKSRISIRCPQVLGPAESPPLLRRMTGEKKKIKVGQGENTPAYIKLKKET